MSPAQPIQQKSIDSRANRFHEITGQAVPRASVAVEEPDTGIKAEFRNSQSRFGFQDSIEKVEHRVGRIHSEPR